MSTGFRLFLLILASFLALWAYRVHREDIELLLATKPLVIKQEGTDFSRSPLEGTIDLDTEEAWIVMQGVEPLVPRQEDSGGLPFQLGTSAIADEVLPVESLPEEEAVPGAGEDGTMDVDEGWETSEESLPDDEHGTLEPTASDAPEESVEAEERDEAQEQKDEQGEARETRWRVYTVEEGDSPWKLAARFLKSGLRYREILAANTDVLGSSEMLQPGMELRIPLTVEEEGSE